MDENFGKGFSSSVSVKGQSKIMANDPLFILVVIAMATVAIILMIGIGGFGRGGEFNRKYANKLMRLRILAQFVAVVLILLFVYFVRGGD